MKIFPIFSSLATLLITSSINSQNIQSQKYHPDFNKNTHMAKWYNDITPPQNPEFLESHISYGMKVTEDRVPVQMFCPGQPYNEEYSPSFVCDINVELLQKNKHFEGCDFSSTEVKLFVGDKKR